MLIKLRLQRGVVLIFTFRGHMNLCFSHQRTKETSSFGEYTWGRNLAAEIFFPGTSKILEMQETHYF